MKNAVSVLNAVVLWRRPQLCTGVVASQVFSLRSVKQALVTLAIKKIMAWLYAPDVQDCNKRNLQWK